MELGGIAALIVACLAIFILYTAFIRGFKRLWYFASSIPLIGPIALVALFVVALPAMLALSCVVGLLQNRRPPSGYIVQFEPAELDEMTFGTKDDRVTDEMVFLICGLFILYIHTPTRRFARRYAARAIRSGPSFFKPTLGQLLDRFRKISADPMKAYSHGWITHPEGSHWRLDPDDLRDYLDEMSRGHLSDEDAREWGGRILRMLSASDMANAFAQLGGNWHIANTEQRGVLALAYAKHPEWKFDISHQDEIVKRMRSLNRKQRWFDDNAV
jgi:hypothetical protein